MTRRLTWAGQEMNAGGAPHRVGLVCREGQEVRSD